MKKKVLILANSASGLYDFRNELLLKLMEKYEVHVSLPDEDKVPELADEGCIVHHTPIDRRGMNPVRDLGLMRSYKRLIKEVRPNVVLTYTIKPNIYGNLCCRMMKIPYIVNITGLGSVFENGGMVQKLVVFLYRTALKNASCIFFQNNKNKSVFESCKIRGKKSRLVPGSGVNLDRHSFEDYPSKEECMKFLYVGRIMKEKGTDELLYAAKEIKKFYPTVEFQIAGNYEDDYKQIIEEYEKENIIHLLGYKRTIHPYYKDAWAVLMPSYHEGMSNVILEAAATGRPVIASDIPGCQEGFDDGVTGLGVQARDKESLFNALKKFIEIPYEEKKNMGANARRKMEKEFDRNLVVNAYMEEIESVIN